MEIIGLSGYARSGKDSAADILVEEFGFTRVAFADKLRECAYQLNPIVGEDGMLLEDVIDKHGWDGYKSTKWGQEVRRILQRMGTEVGRNTISDSIWVDLALTSDDEDAKIVVTDARFENEALAVRQRGGSMWRIDRAGIGPAVSPDGSIHSSETSLDGWNFDVRIPNDGTLEEYHDYVRKVYESRI